MNIDLSSIKNGLLGFLGRYHFLLFFLYVATGLSVGVMLVYGAVELSDESNGYTSQVNNTSFDQGTITRLRDLKASGEQTEQLPRSGRTSPF